MIGDRWTMLIVRDLVNGPRRTLELLSGLFPISSRTLVGRLRDLENDRLVERIDFGGNPPHVEYALTTRGRLLVPLLDSLRQLGEVLACSDCEERKQRMGFYCDSCPLSFAEPVLSSEDSIHDSAMHEPPVPDPAPFRRRERDDSIILL
jgi:DNA-binding HxlR family transcriptional regulator